MIYYVDSIDGNDAADGLSERGAWQTMARLIGLVPGDIVLFRRGGVWVRHFDLTVNPSGTAEQPITFGAYGAGPRPTILIDAQNRAGGVVGLDITGSYIVVRGLRVTLTNPYRNPDYGGAKFGWYVGAAISGHHITLDDCEFSHLALGIYLQGASHHVTITGCHFHDLDALWEIGGAPGIMGAMGVLMHGADNVVAGCRFERNHAEHVTATGQRVTYSAPVEFFNATRCVFTRNVAVGHRKNGELGKRAGEVSADNQYTHNLIVSDRENGRGVNVHGADAWGPVERTLIDHNTIVLAGAGSEAVIASQPGTVLTNNVLVGVRKAAFARQPIEGHNIYQGVVDGFAPAETSRKVHPLLDADYRPLPGSPCLGAASDGTAIGAVQPVAAVVDPAAYAALAEELRIAKANWEIYAKLANDYWARLMESTVERDSARAQLTTLRAALLSLAALFTDAARAAASQATLREGENAEIVGALLARAEQDGAAVTWLTEAARSLGALAGGGE